MAYPAGQTIYLPGGAQSLTPPAAAWGTAKDPSATATFALDASAPLATLGATINGPVTVVASDGVTVGAVIVSGGLIGVPLSGGASGQYSVVTFRIPLSIGATIQAEAYLDVLTAQGGGGGAPGETAALVGLPSSATPGTMLSGITYTETGIATPFYSITQPGGTEGARVALSGGTVPSLTVGSGTGTLTLKLYDAASGGNPVASASATVASAGGGGGGGTPLAPATATVLGGVKQGAGINIAPDGTESVVFGTGAGTAAQGNDPRITGALPASDLGAASGAATLDSTGHVPLAEETPPNPATTTTAGTVEVGTGLSVASDGTESVTFGTTTGTTAEGDDPRITGAVQSSTVGQPSGSAELDSTGHLATAEVPTNLANAVQSNQVGVASGVAELDSTGHLTPAEVPSGIVSTVFSYQGAWQPNLAYMQGQAVEENNLTYGAPANIAGAPTFNVASWNLISTTPGAQGVAGTSIYQGTGVPSSSLGNSGDSYEDVASGDFYKNSAGAWAKTGNLRGLTGAPGSAGLTGNPGSSFREGSGPPSGGLGVGGDSYLNTATGDLYLNTSGTWAKTGNLVGPAGATGAAGASLYQGTGTPTSATGADGDSYVDAVTGNFYKRTSGTWVLTGTLKGQTGGQGGQGIQGVQGIQGTTGLSFREGSGAPSSSLGADGDTYLNTATGTLYQRASGAWTQTENIIGPVGQIGPAGAALLQGSGVPTSSLGNNGDTYIDIATGNTYAKASGAWNLTGNIEPPTSTADNLGTAPPTSGARFNFASAGQGVFDNVITLTGLQSLLGGGGSSESAAFTGNNPTTATIGTNVVFTFTSSNIPNNALFLEWTAHGAATVGQTSPASVPANGAVSVSGTSGTIAPPSTAGTYDPVLIDGSAKVLAIGSAVVVSAVANTWGAAVITNGAYAATSGSTWNQESLDQGYATITPPSLANAAMHIDCYFYVNTLATNQVIFAFNGVTVFVNASGPNFGSVYWYNHNDNTSGYMTLNSSTPGVPHVVRLTIRPESGLQIYGDGLTPGAVSSSMPAPSGNILVGTEDQTTSIQSGNAIWDLQAYSGDPGTGNYTPTNTAPTGAEANTLALYKFNGSGAKLP